MAAINASSPYYLPPNETPALSLVTQTLSGPNYHQWSRTMKIALLSKNKYGFVDGSIEMPVRGDNMFNYWERSNNMVLSWINHAITPSIAQSLGYLEKACDVWKDLKDRFSQTDSLRITELRREIHSLSQGSDSVTDYYTRLKILYDELLHLRPILKCSYDPACSCEAFKTIRDQRDADQVITFLQGLNDYYSTVCSQILLVEPLPALSKVFALSIQHERQLGFTNLRAANKESNPFAGF